MVREMFVFKLFYIQLGYKASNNKRLQAPKQRAFVATMLQEGTHTWSCTARTTVCIQFTSKRAGSYTLRSEPSHITTIIVQSKDVFRKYHQRVRRISCSCYHDNALARAFVAARLSINQYNINIPVPLGSRRRGSSSLADDTQLWNRTHPEESNSDRRWCPSTYRTIDIRYLYSILTTVIYIIFSTFPHRTKETERVWESMRAYNLICLPCRICASTCMLENVFHVSCGCGKLNPGNCIWLLYASMCTL